METFTRSDTASAAVACQGGSWFVHSPMGFPSRLVSRGARSMISPIFRPQGHAARDTSRSPERAPSARHAPFIAVRAAMRPKMAALPRAEPVM